MISPKKSKVNNLSTDKQARFKIANMCCDRESALIEKKLDPVVGIKSIDVNVIGRILYVKFDETKISSEEILDILNKNNLGATLATLGMDESKPEKVNVGLIILMIIAIVSFITLVVAINVFKKIKPIKYGFILPIVLGSFPIL